MIIIATMLVSILFTAFVLLYNVCVSLCCNKAKGWKKKEYILNALAVGLTIQVAGILSEEISSGSDKIRRILILLILIVPALAVKLFLKLKGKAQ